MFWEFHELFSFLNAENIMDKSISNQQSNDQEIMKLPCRTQGN